MIKIETGDILKYPYELPPLPYPYDSLMPAIDGETMHLHHDKHFKTYIDNLNKALEPHTMLQKVPLNTIMKNVDYLPPNVKTAIVNNGGGVYNHNLFFNTTAPYKEENEPLEKLAFAINKQFGSFSNFKKEFTESAKALFGSGYTFLVKTPKGNLKIINLPNQNTPLASGLCPVLLIDVWEHAYYLKYHNLRADYIENFWHVINFAEAEKNLSRCI